eukprot:Phypoly_transcript_04482.p1 GENE.Phypoly_transcript_04482~~Phypoly_transcript_04482.p1  ORF type:complete len:686 (+),score=122.42 Phypoly_transcript_04482:66-2060(+)
MSRYFVVKYDSFGSLATSFNENHIVLPLSRLSITQQDTVIIVASVGGTKKYQGYGHVTNSPENVDKHTIIWDKRYPSSTPCTGAELSGRAMGVSFAKTQHLTNSLDRGNSVNQSRNFQELEENTGRILCEMIAADTDVEMKKFEEMKANAAVQPFYQSEEVDWTDFISKVKEGMGTVLFAGHVGSQCYNLNIPGSDTDMIVIAASPTEEILGLTPPPPTIKNPPTFQPDYTIHEVSHFLDLLVHGDTRMIEQLFQDSSQIVFQHLLWDELCHIREKFLTITSVQKYLDEAFRRKGLLQVEGMWKDMENKQKLNDLDSKTKLMKKMYIMFRLLSNAKQILETGNLNLYFEKDSPDRQFLLCIRNGGFEYQYLHELATKTKVEMEEKMRANALHLEERVTPETLDFCGEWLLRVRWECFKNAPIVPLDKFSTKNDLQVKLLCVATYEPYASPPNYISVFSAKTSLLLVSPVGQTDAGKTEVQAQKLVEKLESEETETAQTGRIARNSAFMELGKFFELSAQNSLKTAELLYTPPELVVFALPEWESAMTEIRNSGALLSIRLSRKCVEVAKKAASGKDAESVATRFQIWRLAAIVAAHLKRKDPSISFPGDLQEFLKMSDFTQRATDLISQMDKGLQKMEAKDEITKVHRDKELSSVLLTFRNSFL